MKAAHQWPMTGASVNVRSTIHHRRAAWVIRNASDVRLATTAMNQGQNHGALPKANQKKGRGGGRPPRGRQNLCWHVTIRMLAREYFWRSCCDVLVEVGPSKVRTAVTSAGLSDRAIFRGCVPDSTIGAMDFYPTSRFHFSNQTLCSSRRSQ